MPKLSSNYRETRGDARSSQWSRGGMIPLREVIIRFLLACIALNMKVTLYPLAKFWGYRRFEPQPETVMVTCAGHVHTKAARPSASWLFGGCFQREAVPQAA